jgi:2-polyprenyl-3-methyl-5-hydroxy-6-metoxy-1,4-benzoquinol methylase
MASIKDDRGFNQGFELVRSTEIRMKRRADYMVSKMDLSQEKTILEIGCGTGEVSYWIAQHSNSQVIGTDLCVPFIEQANQKFKLPNLRFEVLDFNNPQQINDRKFDYIIGNGILHHLYYHMDDVLVRLKTLLKDKGRIIFLEPNIYNPYCAIIFNFARKWANLEPDEMAFSKPYIRKKLVQAGFHDVNIEFKDFLLPGIPDFMIRPSIAVGNVLEKIPVARMVSQSIYIDAGC